MDSVDKRLDKIEEGLQARITREQMRGRPLVVTVQKGEPIPHFEPDANGLVPLVIIRGAKRSTKEGADHGENENTDD